MAAGATAPASASMSARAMAITATTRLMGMATVLTPITPIGADGIFIAGITAGTSESALSLAPTRLAKGHSRGREWPFCLVFPVNAK